MESNVLNKTTNKSVISRFFPWTPAMIRWIVRISDIVNQFLKKTFWFFDLGSRFSSTESDIDKRLEKACTTIDRLLIIWKLERESISRKKILILSKNFLNFWFDAVE